VAGGTPRIIFSSLVSGIGLVFEDADRKNVNSLRQQLEELFVRDWSSPYAHPLNGTCHNLRMAKGPLGRPQLVPPLYSHHVSAAAAAAAATI
jgi:hypothetical protein